MMKVAFTERREAYDDTEHDGCPTRCRRKSSTCELSCDSV